MYEGYKGGTDKVWNYEEAGPGVSVLLNKTSCRSGPTDSIIAYSGLCAKHVSNGNTITI